MSRIIHFEIPADDPKRAMAFYAKMFNWSFQQFGEMPYFMASTGPREAPGIDGAIMPRQQPGQTVNNVVQVNSLDEAMAQVAIYGGQVLTPKIPIPGIGHYCNCTDTEGNTFGMMQPDPSAAAA